MSETRQTYRYRGTDRNGDGRFGVWTDTPSGLAARVEKWYAQGWRTLTVVAGEGPNPPAEDEPLQVAGIGRRPGERRRTCWYEKPASPVWRCEDCGWPWPLPGDPPAGAECDNCGGELTTEG